jgi:uncharacterized small protein (DUF1192 family)
MMIEEEANRPTGRFLPARIDSWGVEELRAYIAELQAEIARAEREIGKRDAHRNAADAFFRKPG